MNTKPPESGDERPQAQTPEVDETLAAALTAQREPGVRALGLLRDARQILVGTFLERPGEVAESCLRGAADALLSLPGAPATPVGLKSAAAGLLDAVDALPAPRVATSAAQAGRDNAVPDVSTPAFTTAADAAGAEEAWERVSTAAGVLRRQLARPGGYHRSRAAGIAERLMGVKLGAAQEEAPGVWGEMYSATSGTLHGAAAEAGRRARNTRWSWPDGRTRAPPPSSSAPAPLSPGLHSCRSTRRTCCCPTARPAGRGRPPRSSSTSPQPTRPPPAHGSPSTPRRSRPQAGRHWTRCYAWQAATRA